MSHRVAVACTVWRPLRNRRGTGVSRALRRCRTSVERDHCLPSCARIRCRRSVFAVFPPVASARICRLPSTSAVVGGQRRSAIADVLRPRDGPRPRVAARRSDHDRKICDGTDLMRRFPHGDSLLRRGGRHELLGHCLMADQLVGAATKVRCNLQLKVAKTAA